MKTVVSAVLGTVFLFCFFETETARAVDARMLRMPDVSASEIAFVYAGDIWVVDKQGGLARRLSSPPGEETFPRFTPDGSRIAYNANYDGNIEIYVVDRTGGLPQRVTHHPAQDRLLDWFPDGRRLLMASSAESGSQRFSQFYEVDSSGGLPVKLPLPFGEFGSISPDGKTLAFTPRTRDYRTWKRYRGGMESDIWLFDLDTFESENITRSPATESHPMWHGQTLYFLADRGPNKRFNIWAYDTVGKSMRQVTHFDEYDIHFPAIGPDDIVLEAGGRLYRLELATEQLREVPVEVVTDERSLLPKVEKTSRLIRAAGISPEGKRAVFEARGEIYTLPAEHGVIRNLTHDPGVAERDPAWSPDGRWVAYWSDRSGEYELTLRRSDGSGEEEQLTSLGPGFRFTPYWSPDSKKLAFIDQAMRMKIYDRDTGQVTEFDRGLYMTFGPLSGFRVGWSPDSKWLAYSRDTETRSRAIVLYSLETATAHQVTSGYYADTSPVFDPDGKYLYFLTNRDFTPSYSDFDNTWVYANATQIAAVPLTAKVESPLAPRNDEEGAEQDEDEDSEKEGDPESDDREESSDDESEAQADKKDEKESKKEPKPTEITLEGFEQRIVLLPPPAGNYSRLFAVSGKVLFVRNPRTGAARDEKNALVYYDLKEREEKPIIADVNFVDVSKDQKKLLISQNNAWGIINLAPNQKLEKRLAIADMESLVDPRREWRQLFSDAWRFQRDFFYDPNLHQVDWNAIRTQYGRLIDDCVTRWDVNYVIGEMIAELNASHTYRGGGDVEQGADRAIGLLGVDWTLENGAYRIKRIVRGAPWDTEVRSPFDEPAVDVNEGDYVLSVNGVPIDTSRAPWAAFSGLSEKTVALQVNSEPNLEGSRQVVVKTLASEARLRHLEWIESNRKRVEEASGGRVGYVYVPNTGRDGQSELARQFYGQFTKEGLIIDERFNSGGQIPDRFIELLNRRPLSFWAVRDGKDWQWPPVAHFGPKVMLINGWSGSGGDAFPYYFREAGLGPLIGARTWGGLIGISGAPSLVDGGAVTVPTFRMYGTDGEWFSEGHGVDPDIEVVEDPTQMARGIDPQLERAIEEVLRLMDSGPYVAPSRPAYEDRSK